MTSPESHLCNKLIFHICWNLVILPPGHSRWQSFLKSLVPNLLLSSLHYQLSRSFSCLTEFVLRVDKNNVVEIFIKCYQQLIASSHFWQDDFCESSFFFSFSPGRFHRRVKFWKENIVLGSFSLFISFDVHRWHPLIASMFSNSLDFMVLYCTDFFWVACFDIEQRPSISNPVQALQLFL